MQLSATGAAIVTAIIAVVLLNHGGIGHGWWLFLTIPLGAAMFAVIYSVLREMFGD